MYAKGSNGKEIVGTLMTIEEDPNSRYRFEIWFDYTRETMNTVSEGAMVAIPNFYLDPEDRNQEWSSVVEISTLLPVHYAIAQNHSGFPGFLEEAARSAAQDWIDQETQSTDDTTKIRCIAIPTNLMMNEKGDIREEQGLPMVGHKARLLDTETTERFANLGIERERDDVARIGPLIRDESVSIFLRVEEALRTHFAVFGYTGAGKSNLLSTIIAKFLSERDGKPPVKLIVLDLMGEFSVLLMDLLVDLPNARFLAVGPETLPDSVLEYYKATGQAREHRASKAAEDLARTSLYPKAIKARQDDFISAYACLLSRNKIRIWQEAEQTIGTFVREKREEICRGNMGSEAQAVNLLLDRVAQDFINTHFSRDALQQVLEVIQSARQNLGVRTAINNVTKLERMLSEEAGADRPVAPQACRVTIPSIVSSLNDANGAALTVIQAADPDKLRIFAQNLGTAIYNERRKSGQITPLVTFIFDEADEFIPLNFDKDSSYAYSTAIAMTLARRGRKFGLGIGIATQRVTYLNTSIMAQPHTYFISKLPRKSDRERVCEAFGISEDMFRQTFKFKKGNWLLVSHDATGLESVPLPIRTDNADERILKWLDSKRDELRLQKPVAAS
ncbi:MAG TPA: DUF87 domain-containing protein [Terriglobia bacterium]|jgi:hypothetical protein|nr:DUF87 domain-containing protein [Terriglobia bacterium]